MNNALLRTGHSDSGQGGAHADVDGCNHLALSPSRSRSRVWPPAAVVVVGAEGAFGTGLGLSGIGIGMWNVEAGAEADSGWRGTLQSGVPFQRPITRSPLHRLHCSETLRLFLHFR